MIYPNGTVNLSAPVRILDATTGAPLTGLAYDTPGLAFWLWPYHVSAWGAKTAIPLASLAGVDATHTDGGFVEIGDGDYRLDLPDQALIPSGRNIRIGGAAPNGVVFAPTLQFAVETSMSPGSLDALMANMEALVGVASDLGSGATHADNLADIAAAAAALSSAVAALPTASQNAAAAGALTVEGTITLIQAQRALLAVLLGKVSGAQSNLPVFRDTADSKNRVSATTDASGNRSAVSLDLT